MNWLEFFASVIKSLAWPSTVLATILILRKSIVAQLPRLQKAKWKDFEFEFKERIQEIEQEADEAQIPRTPVPTALPAPRESDPDITRILELVPVSPRMALVESWRLLEAEMRSAILRRGKVPPKSIGELTQMVEMEGLLPPDSSWMVESLRSLRNRAVHSAPFPLDEADVMDFVRLAIRFIQALRNAT